MTEAAFWWVHTVSVRPVSAYGEPIGDPVSVDCWRESETMQVTDRDGNQVVSNTVVRGALADADKFVPGSTEVTWDDQTARVITLKRLDSGALDIGLDHFEARLT